MSSTRVRCVPVRRCYQNNESKLSVFLYVDWMALRTLANTSVGDSICVWHRHVPSSKRFLP